MQCSQKLNLFLQFFQSNTFCIKFWFFFNMCRFISAKIVWVLSKNTTIPKSAIIFTFVYLNVQNVSQNSLNFYYYFDIEIWVPFKWVKRYKNWKRLKFISNLFDLKIAPKLGDIIRQKNLTIGSHFQVYCAVEKGSLPVFFEWFKNSNSLKPSPDVNYKIEFTKISSTLIIENVEINDQGNYTCIAKNPFGSDSKIVLLNIKGMCKVS